jgi:CHAT domain-containing protein
VLASGPAATFDAVAAARAPRCVHIAAHGRFRPDAPSMGGVRLADGWLRAIDFATLRLPGALVVLSGCETGVSRVGPGDEIHGLVRGVFASGATELVASLWRVGDESTARFMSSFHARRAGGLCAEHALAETQRESAATGLPVWAWAGFALWTRQFRHSAGTSC